MKPNCICTVRVCGEGMIIDHVKHCQLYWFTATRVGSMEGIIFEIEKTNGREIKCNERQCAAVLYTTTTPKSSKLNAFHI